VHSRTSIECDLDYESRRSTLEPVAVVPERDHPFPGRAGGASKGTRPAACWPGDGRKHELPL
jgi:hypothetical protein